MKDLKNIIDEVKKFRTDEFNPSDDMILDCSTRILLSRGVQKPKAQRQQSRKRFEIKDPKSPATDNQKYKLDELKVTYPKELTKGEAHQLIDEHMKKESSEKKDAS